MKMQLFFTPILTLLFQTAFSQQNALVLPDGKQLSTTAIDTRVQHLMDTAGVTGLCIGIVQNNEVYYVKSYGYKNRTTGQRNDNSTSFSAASLSKPVFAYLVMQLVDEGIINLDKPLYEYLPKPLPEYKNYKDLSGDERWKLITPRMCLNHTTGFPNWRQLNPTGTQKLQLFFTPGTRYAYSGEGLYLLQFVIETVASQKLEALVQKKICKPFGMTRTSFVWQPYFDTNYAVGHNYDEDTLAITKRSEANAAGSMQTTIADYTQFISCVLQGKGLSERSKHEMLSRQTGIFTKRQFPSLNNDTTSKYKSIQLSYGLGWGLFKSSYGWAFFKEGHSDDGWEHYTIGFRDNKSALIIMTNSLNGESIFKELVEDITGILIPWEWEGYTPYLPTVKMPEKSLEQYTGEYTGRVKAIVSLEKGQLKIVAPAEGLSKTNLYATAENRFFLKSIPVSLEFIKQADGKFKKLQVNDEGTVYELTKIDKADPTPIIANKPSGNTLSAYVGKYALANNPGRTLVIKLEKEDLVAQISSQSPLQLVFNSETSFKAKSIIDIKGEFISENGKVIKLIIDQNGKYEWIKIE